MDRGSSSAEESPFDEHGRCRVSKKHPYRDKVSALLMNAGRPIMARVYLCKHCKRWHLTRKAK